MTSSSFRIGNDGRTSMCASNLLFTVERPQDSQALCREPAAFHYVGLQWDERKASRNENIALNGPRLEIDLCLTCARAALIRLEPTLREGRLYPHRYTSGARMWRLGYSSGERINTLSTAALQLLTMRCSHCFQTFRIGRLAPTGAIGSVSFCPLCGKPAGAVLDPDQDWWEAIADLLEVPFRLCKMLHQEWLETAPHHMSGERVDLFVKWARRHLDELEAELDAADAEAAAEAGASA